MTGHRIVTFVLLTSMLFSGCQLFLWDDAGDYSYISYIKNATSKILKLTIGPNFTGYSIDTLLNPSEKLELKGSREVDKEENVVRDIM